MRKHPLNQKFRWRQAETTRQLLSAEQVDAYRKCGGFVLPDLFSAAEISGLLAELDPIADASNSALAAVPAGQPGIARQDEIVFQPHVVVTNKVARRFATHPKLRALCNDLIGGAVRLYWDQLVYKYPGVAVDFPWHQDNGYNFVQPQQYLTCWVALTTATVDNGCPWISPGLHLQGTLHHHWTDLGFCCFADSPPDAYALPLQPGSVAVFSSLTPHRTGPNLTDEVRKAYILQYAPDGARIFPRDGEPFAADDDSRQFMINEG